MSDDEIVKESRVSENIPFSKSNLSYQQDVFEREVILDDLKRTLQFATTDEQKFRSRTIDINSHQKKFSKLQTKIEKYLMLNNLFNKEEQIKIRNDFDDYYHAIITHSNKLKRADEQCRRASSLPLIQLKKSNTNAKLPKLSLPTFSGNYADWNSYRDLYDSLVHCNTDYTNVEKFRYLLLTLKYEPYNLIKSISITEDNYQGAYDILIKRYDNKRKIATHHLEKILDIEPCNDKNINSLRIFLNTYHEHIKALEALNFDFQNNLEWSFIIVTILLRKIPISFRREFERKLPLHTSIPAVESLITFLEHELAACEISNPNCGQFTKTASDNLNSKQFRSGSASSGANMMNKSFAHKRTFAAGFTPQNIESAYSASNIESNIQGAKAYSCLLCDAQHTLTKCSKFLNLTPSERYSFIQEKNVCFNCLHVGHDVRHCKSSFVCRSCKKRHHTLLHFESNKQSLSCMNEPGSLTQGGSLNDNNSISLSPNKNVYASSSDTSIMKTSDSGQVAMTSSVVGDRSRAISSKAPFVRTGTVLLSTALVDVCVNNTKRSTVRCLIDTGSQVSFISEACVQRLNIAKKHVNFPPVFGINEDKPVHPKGAVFFQVAPRNKSSPIVNINALVLPKLMTTNMPACPLPSTGWSHIENLTLADPEFYTPQPVEVLLGADVLSEILLYNTITGLPGSPIAMNSIFGYLLLGKIDFDSVSISTPIHACHSSFSEDFDLKRFWELESVSEQKSLTPDELLCEKIYNDTHIRDDSGRYVVALPFKPDAPPLGESRDIAVARFRKLECKLERNPQLKRDYHACLQEYIDLDHMESVDSQAAVSSSYYIPHHAVVNQSSETTKTRVVYDASCKTTQGNSLNDILLVGQKLHLDIVDVLLKFRIHSIVFTADIKQMYRNILIREQDRDFQRIVWRSSPQDPLRDYRLKTVTFGVSSSPYLALRTMQQLAQDEAARFPRAARVLQSDVFVDDVVSGDNSEAGALTLQRELVDICRTAGFELHKWHSNSAAILAAARPDCSDGERRDSVLFAEMENDKKIKVLGLQWHPKNDAFAFSVKTNSEICTKRSILSEIARIYDPLGLLSPVTLFAKHLIQLLWIARVDWDETPPQEIVNSWSTFVSELPLLTQVSFPRHVFSKNRLIQLHGFSDASERAYAACIYLRVQNEEGEVDISLLLAKTRVAPTKRISIPRLELMAALLLAKIMQKVLHTYVELISPDQLFAWSDSTIVLSWLRAAPHEWKTFVSNRITEILQAVPTVHWRHVPSADNPADAASRGMLPASFLEHDLWFHGPQWLHEEESVWPVLHEKIHTEEEKRSVVIVSNPSLSSTPPDAVEIISRFSSLGKLVRVTALIFRFIEKIKNPKTTFPSHITVPEYNFTLNRLIFLVQHSVFSEDIKKLLNGKEASDKVRRLNPFVDKSEFLRVGGRIHKSLLPFDSKHQVILPKNHPLTILIIDDAHISNMHSGAQSTLHLLLQRYWILSSRNVVRSRIHRCVRCFRARPPRSQPSMATLPATRLRPERPFLKTSVDFAGPFYVRANKVRNAKITKCYVAVFVCMCVKAIHLELVSELSTEAFLASLRRFTSRRGLCKDIYSDCGRNFVGCDRYLQELYNFLRTDKIQSTLNNKILEQGITWHFQPPYASHFGGLFEAGVKSFKHHLHRVIGNRTLTYDEMHTYLCQIEAILNSRPLCVLSADAKDALPLTPSHFLIGEPLTAIPDVSLEETNPSRLVRWRLIQQSIQHFWRRWSREYLHEIQQQNKWFKGRGSPVSVDSIVVICDDNSPPLQWRLARVHAVHPGSDGITRVVTLQVGSNFIKRPVVKICPLPIS
ncbi:uncharacterized protein LOC126369487 [Pectinophora gossypiella]|uniref:uncharacterized protein LOC126369487 n=1 Tax=Pectinophora gossypiella TaxID=13191 RepID=UPI00214F3ED7|nr:uncharacterized protein LOC126369487 [Pectinophora gossypiella]